MTAAQTEPDCSGIVEVTLTDARARIYELVDAIADGTFVYLTRNGRRVAAIMPADVAENYERIEDDYWARRSADIDSSDTVPYSQAIAELESEDEQA